MLARMWMRNWAKVHGVEGKTKTGALGGNPCYYYVLCYKAPFLLGTPLVYIIIYKPSHLGACKYITFLCYYLYFFLQFLFLLFLFLHNCCSLLHVCYSLLLISKFLFSQESLGLLTLQTYHPIILYHRAP